MTPPQLSSSYKLRGRHFFAVFLSLLSPEPLPFSVSSCGMNMKKKKTGSDFFFLTLCVTMRTTEYQLLLLLFLFSNFAKYLYSLDAWRIMYSQERDCIWNVFSNGKQRAKNPSRINNWIFTAKEKQGTLCLCLKWEAVFFHSLGNDSLQSTAREIRGHGLWNCYFSQLTVCRWHGL